MAGEVVVQIAGIYGDAHPHPDKRAVVIMVYTKESQFFQASSLAFASVG